VAAAMTGWLAACASQVSPGPPATKPSPPPPAPTVQAPAAPAPQPEPAPAPTAAQPQPGQTTTPTVPQQPMRAYATAARLLPMSGPSALTGEALFNAAQLALFEIGDKDFTLLPFDTKGTPEGAAAAVQQAVAAHPDIILGPLFSGEVKATAPVAREASIPMVA